MSLHISQRFARRHKPTLTIIIITRAPYPTIFLDEHECELQKAKSSHDHPNDPAAGAAFAHRDRSGDGGGRGRIGEGNRSRCQHGVERNVVIVGVLLSLILNSVVVLVVIMMERVMIKNKGPSSIKQACHEQSPISIFLFSNQLL